MGISLKGHVTSAAQAQLLAAASLVFVGLACILAVPLFFRHEALDSAKRAITTCHNEAGALRIRARAGETLDCVVTWPGSALDNYGVFPGGLRMRLDVAGGNAVDLQVIRPTPARWEEEVWTRGKPGPIQVRFPFTVPPNVRSATGELLGRVAYATPSGGARFSRAYDDIRMPVRMLALTPAEFDRELQGELARHRIDRFMLMIGIALTAVGGAWALISVKLGGRF